MHVRGTTNIAALCDFGDNSKFEQWPPSCRNPCTLVLLSSFPSGASKPSRPEQHLRLYYSNAVTISKLPSLGFATARTKLKHTAYVLVKGGAAELSLWDMLVPACRSCCCLHRVHLQEEWGQVACSNKLARHLLTKITQDENFGRSEESEPFSAPGATPMSRCRNRWFLRNFFDAARRQHRGDMELRFPSS